MFDYTFKDNLEDILLDFSFATESELEEIIKELCKYDDYIKCFTNINVSLLQNDTSIEEFNTSIEAIEHFKQHLTFDEQDSYRLKIEVLKESNGELAFLSYTSFENCLPDKFIDKISKLEDLYSNFNKITFFNDKMDVELTINSEVKFDTDNLFHRYSLEWEPKYSPESYYKHGAILQNKYPDNIFKLVSSFLILCIFSNKTQINDEKCFFEFKGITTKIITINSMTELTERSSEIYELFKWLFEDVGVVAKLSIIRNIICLQKEEKLSDVFTNETIYSIESNHHIYQEDNVKQYFEIKNKIIEFVFGLTNKLSESYDAYRNSSKLNLISVLSYLATLVVIRGLAKEQMDSTGYVFLGVVSLIIFVVAFMYNLLQYETLKSQISFLKKQKSEIRSRYVGTLNDKELNSLVSSTSFDQIETNSDNDKYHIVISTTLILLSIADIVAIAIVSSIP